jgi:hypothetical protein
MIKMNIVFVNVHYVRKKCKISQGDIQAMQQLFGSDYAKVSLVSILFTAVISSIHHVYRDGFEQIVIWAILIALPLVLMTWFRRTESRWALWLYGLYNLVIITQLGVVDGFLDHTLKALGVPHLTFLPGGDAEVVATVFSLWSPQAGNVFYEGTGVLAFIGSIFATFYLYRFIHAQRTAGRTSKTSIIANDIIGGQSA